MQIHRKKDRWHRSDNNMWPHKETKNQVKKQKKTNKQRNKNKNRKRLSNKQTFICIIIIQVNEKRFMKLDAASAQLLKKV